MATQLPLEPPEQPDDYDDDNYEPTQEELLGMDDEQLLAFVRNGGRFGGGRRPPRGRPSGSAGQQQQQRQQQRRAGQGSHAAGQGGVPPRPHGTGHSWRAGPHPELPKKKRPCLLCKKPGHLAAACPNKPALALQGEQLPAAHGSAQRSFEIRVAESKGGERREAISRQAD